MNDCHNHYPTTSILSDLLSGFDGVEPQREG